MIDLSKYADFSVTFVDHEHWDNVDDGYFCISIRGQEVVKAFLNFTPNEVFHFLR